MTSHSRALIGSALCNGLWLNSHVISPRKWLTVGAWPALLLGVVSVFMGHAAA